jgi:hypothetical protein
LLLDKQQTTPFTLQRVYYLGLREALVEPNLRDPDFCAELGRHRTPDDTFSFWGSPEYRRLDRLTGLGRQSQQRGLQHDVLAISIAADFGGPYESKKQHSTGVVAVRCANSNTNHKVKRNHC